MKFSEPLKLSGALKVKSVPSKEAAISTPVETVYESASPSISLADKVTLSVPSSLKDTSASVAKTGASLTEFTNKDTDALSVNSPSDTWNVNSSDP